MSQDPHHRSENGTEAWQEEQPEEWWFDLIEGEDEGETAPAPNERRSPLLLLSPADRKRLNELKELRELIRTSDDVPLPEDGRTYQAMHDRIMAAIDGQPKSGRRPKRTRTPRRSLPRPPSRQY